MHPSIITLNQDSDTSARREITPRAVLTYLYDRSRDSKKSGTPGQDFIAYCYDDTRVAFAVCDGVSQSFYGDLAARFLGERLVAWLMTLPNENVLNENFAGEVDGVLRAWTEQASQIVQAKQPAASLPPMIRDALERKRENGSESMFVAGLLDFMQGTLAVCWMGDMRLWLWADNGESVELPGAIWLTKERWSTRLGPKNGAPHAAVLSLDSLVRLTVHTDGVGSRAPELRTVTPEQLNQLAGELNAAPASDDVSVLEITLSSVAAPQLATPQPRVPDPQEPVLRWEGIDGATWYRVEMTAGDSVSAYQWTADTPNISFILPNGQPEPTTCRVQALSDNHRPSAWGEPVIVGRRKLAMPSQEAVPATVAEAEPIVTGSRPFQTGVIMVGALLLALALTVGWFLIYLK